MDVNRQTLPLCWPGPNHFIKAPAPSRAERKTARTTRVLTSRQETQSTKLIPNAACWNRQVHTDGRPMNTREHRKQSFSDRRSRKLSSELLARTLRWIRFTNKEVVIYTLMFYTQKCERISNEYNNLCFIILVSYHWCLTVIKKKNKHGCCHRCTRHSCCSQSNS